VAATNRCLTVLADRTTVVLNSKPAPKVFTFDYAVPENASQEEIFLSIGRPITSACLEGYNSTVLAYGQTGSGKSHTMVRHYPTLIVVHLSPCYNRSATHDCPKCCSPTYCSSTASFLSSPCLRCVRVPVCVQFGPDSIMSSGGVDAAGAAKDLQGLVPRCLDYMFMHIARETRRTNGAVQYTCRCSFFEIFNERVFDLLDAAASGDSASRDDGAPSDRSSTSSSRASRGSSSSMMLPLEDAGLAVREDTRRGVYVDGLNEVAVASAQEAGQALGKGYRNRRVAETAMNRESSRSHAVFQLLVESTERGTGKDSDVRKAKQSRYSLVDLAGSERQKSTSATGDRLKEANAINKSLSALGLVINALVDRGLGKMRHVPYRDSKLTFLLRDSLGGNSRTTLVATVSPSEEQFGESLSTLKFSQRAKMITNTAVVNEEAVGSLETLQKEVQRLKQELIRAKSLTLTKATPPAGDDAGATAALPSAASPVEADALLSESLERFMVVHEQSKRYMGQLTTAHDAAARYQEMVHAANLIIKLLRANAAAAKAPAEASGAALDSRDAATLAAVEKSLVRLPEVEKWRLACEAMKGELERLSGLSPAEPPAELGTTLATDPAALKALADMAAGRRDRDRALAGRWTEAQEAAFQLGLEERFAKVVRERDALRADLAAASQTGVASPTNSASGELNDALSMFSSQFGDSSGKPSLDLMCDDAELPPPPSLGRLSSTGRRSSVGNRRVSVGGKVVCGLSDVSSWSAAHEMNRKLREADGKAEALAKQLEAKTKEVAELGKANAVLAREKAELLAAKSSHSNADEAAPGSVDEVAFAAAVQAAVLEAMAGADAQVASLKAEVEAAVMARLGDAEAADKAEAALRTLAQVEIEACSAAKADAAAAKDDAAAAKTKAQEAMEAEEAARAESAAAKEAEEAAGARCKGLEDELETAGAQVAFLTARAETAATDAAALKAKLAAAEEATEAGAVALAEAKKAGAALQAQLLASSLDTGSALEGLKQQLAEQAAQLAAALDDARDANALRSTMTNALAQSEHTAAELRSSLAAVQASERATQEVVAELTGEVKELRERAGAAAAGKERLRVELEALRVDRDEVAAALKDAELDASDAREELEEQKGQFLEELAKQADATSELEEALEAEQQMAMDATAKHKAELAEALANFEAKAAALRAEASAAGARAEQAEAEAAVLKRETQRDVVDGERELLATQASLRREEKARRDLASALAVAQAKVEEQSRTASELALQVSSLEGERERLRERTISRDVELEKAQRESHVLCVEADMARQRHAATAEKLAELEASQAEAAAAVEAAEARAMEAAAEAATSRAMEKEAHEAAVEAGARAAGLQTALHDATARLEEYAKQVASLAGHGNAKQKIHAHLKLKEEINELQKVNTDLSQKVGRLQAGLPLSPPPPPASALAPPPLPPPPASKRAPTPPSEEEAPKENAVATEPRKVIDECMSSPQPALAARPLASRIAGNH